MRYVAADAEHVDALDRIARTLHTLVEDGRGPLLSPRASWFS